MPADAALPLPVETTALSWVVRANKEPLETASTTGGGDQVVINAGRFVDHYQVNTGKTAHRFSDFGRLTSGLPGSTKMRAITWFAMPSQARD